MSQTCLYLMFTFFASGPAETRLSPQSRLQWDAAPSAALCVRRETLDYADAFTDFAGVVRFECELGSTAYALTVPVATTYG
jgi:hypothetical protein